MSDTTILKWISVAEQPIPTDSQAKLGIFVSAPMGVNAIMLKDDGWYYWYSKLRVESEDLKNITHWCFPRSVVIQA